MGKVYLNKVSNGNIVLSGRPNGEKAREILKIAEKDISDKNYNIIIPNNIRTINPSYFLGLFSYSINNLGLKKFREKYNFIMESGEEISSDLNEDIEEGIEWALDDSVILS
ncbi:hypothetical protein [Fusobacterium varium]|uniref:hypothetical protein n=1 Tax=Fusobacterium varium TaxID=856 RepID=UPI002FE4F9C6